MCLLHLVHHQKEVLWGAWYIICTPPPPPKKSNPSTIHGLGKQLSFHRFLEKTMAVLVEMLELSQELCGWMSDRMFDRSWLGNFCNLPVSFFFHFHFSLFLSLQNHSITFFCLVISLLKLQALDQVDSMKHLTMHYQSWYIVSLSRFNSMQCNAFEIDPDHMHPPTSTLPAPSVTNHNPRKKAIHHKKHVFDAIHLVESTRNLLTVHWDGLAIAVATEQQNCSWWHWGIPESRPFSSGQDQDCMHDTNLER